MQAVPFPAKKYCMLIIHEPLSFTFLVTELWKISFCSFAY